MKRLLTPALLLFIILACTGTKGRRGQFESIYNLVADYKLDSAQSLLDRVDTSALSAYDYALYKMQDVIIRYRRYEPLQDTVSLNCCIEAFERYGDSRNLCRCYAFKANILVEKGKADEAIPYLKKAEDMVENSGDNDTEMRIFCTLAHVNIASSNARTALKYADKTINAARKSGAERWLALGYNMKATAFDLLGATDSNSHYVKAMIPHVRVLTRHEQAHALNNIALAYSNENNYDSAEFFFRRSLMSKPLPHVYGNLAVLNMNNNREDSVEEMFRESFKTNDLGVKIYLMTKFSEWLQKQKRYEEASAVGLHVKSLYDSLAQTQKTERVKGLQENFDMQAIEETSTNREQRWLTLVACALLIVIVVCLLYRKTVTEGRSRMTEMNEKVALMESDIEKLQQDRKDGEREAKELRRRAEQLKREMSDVMARGKQRFESLTEHGETIADWHKNDLVDAIEYYSMLRPMAMKRIEDTYKGLSVTQILYLQLCDYGLDDKETKRIFGLSDGAMRTMRSRINSKMR